MLGENMTDAGRGTDNALAGDVIRMRLTVEHDALGYAGGGAEILYRGVNETDITLSEDEFGAPFDPWEIGRHVLTRIVASDGPEDSVQPHNVDVFASDAFGGKITDENDDFFNFASTPPGIGGITPPPIGNGDPIFVFDYVYRGGEDLWDVGHNGLARVWRNGQDVNGLEVPASSGDTFVVSPAPATLGVLGCLLVIPRRQARDPMQDFK
eukprot:TRINITY_DN12843_c0_g1_i6.p1 TRINITY_DN12843_c0_g1~~TRINITY_DN12843_c0_g1_i6.p1  ORF type:complete len:210 (-),score=23.61 TRINITY_DN12843_c0_g1_i6:575-1204(-)